ncbi:MAG: NIPSNAP family protein [Puia sp.]|nr:NIPSNAP family protein [Puia sp.]
MDRRKFVRSALLSGSVLGAPIQIYKKDDKDSMKGKNKQRQWYELRTYFFANDAQRQLTGAYLEQAALPALNRAGIGNIGVFSEWQPQGSGKMYLLIPFESIDSFAAVNEKLAHDESYLKAGEAYLSAPATAPAYERIESSLLKAFVHMPLIEVPEKKERLFELRCYESPSEAAGQKKITMFNDAGEVDIFKKIGARPVFFGETMIGERRPNLIYMLCFDNMEAHDARWKAFGSDPEWKKISGMPEYSDALLISRITRTFLVPTGYSQV